MTTKSDIERLAEAEFDPEKDIWKYSAEELGFDKEQYQEYMEVWGDKYFEEGEAKDALLTYLILDSEYESSVLREEIADYSGNQKDLLESEVVREQLNIFSGHHPKREDVGVEEVTPIFYGEFGPRAGVKAKNPIFEDGEYKFGAGAGAKKPIFKGGEYRTVAGAYAKKPIFKGGEFENGAGLWAEHPIFKGGEYGSWVGAGAEKPIFEEGKFESRAGMNAKHPIFEDGEFEWYAGEGAEHPIFKDGDFEKRAGEGAEHPIIFGGSYGKNTLKRAEGIKAYVQDAETIRNPESGFVIADDVEEVILDEDGYLDEDEYTDYNSKDTFVYTTKDNVSGKYSENSAYIKKENLEEIKDEVNLQHFKDIDDYETLSLAMDQLICRVDEKAKNSIKALES